MNVSKITYFEKLQHNKFLKKYKILSQKQNMQLIDTNIIRITTNQNNLNHF